jgi:hypothetical protein
MEPHAVKGIAAIIIAASVIGCATSTTAPSQTVTAQPHRIYWDNATGDSYAIKISRDTGQMGSLCMTRIAVDGKNAADLNPGEGVVFKVPAGEHLLSVWQISGGSSSGKTFCDGNPMRQEVNVVGTSGDSIAYRYSYSGSGSPSLTATSF